LTERSTVTSMEAAAMAVNHPDLDVREGDVKSHTVSARGIIVIINPDSNSRKKFREFLAYYAGHVIAVPCESNDNTDSGDEATGMYNRRTGERRLDVEATVSAWQVMGKEHVLEHLTGVDVDGRRVGSGKAFVSSWHNPINIRVGGAAAGAGPEKARKSMGSMFGKPTTIAATQATIATARATKARTELASGNE
jgi:hypothetical protein